MSDSSNDDDNTNNREDHRGEVRRPPDPHSGDDAALGHDQAREMFDDYLADQLSPRKREQFVVHIRTCGPCHNLLFSLRLGVHVLGGEIKSSKRQADQ